MLSTQPDSRHKLRPVEVTSSFPAAEPSKRAAHSVKDWCQQVSISPAYFYELKKKGIIDTAKLFGKVLVLTDPREFVESFRTQAS